MIDSFELIDDEEEGYQFPVAYYGIDEEFEHPGPYRWVITSPNGVRTTKEAAAILFSPLDYGIWSVELHLQNDDDEWECQVTHEFDNPDPESPGEATLVTDDSGSVN